MHAEYEQERIAYQKLLKDYNRLEAQMENLQDELQQARGGNLDRSLSSASFMSSMVAAEDESAYGSRSGNGRHSLFGNTAYHNIENAIADPQDLLPRQSQLTKEPFLNFRPQFDAVV